MAKERIRKIGRAKKVDAEPSAPRLVAPRYLAPAVKPVVRTAPPPVRDGLLWLIERNKLSAKQRVAALGYRTAFRATDGVSVPSCLGALDRVDSAGRDVAIAIGVDFDAARKLHHLRHVVLGGQSDLLTVMDGVVGVGHVLRALAGGDGHRAQALEMILYVALDLISNTPLTNVHEPRDQKLTHGTASAA